MCVTMSAAVLLLDQATGTGGGVQCRRASLGQLGMERGGGGAGARAAAGAGGPTPPSHSRNPEEDNERERASEGGKEERVIPLRGPLA